MDISDLERLVADPFNPPMDSANPPPRHLWCMDVVLCCTGDGAADFWRRYMHVGASRWRH